MHLKVFSNYLYMVMKWNFLAKILAKLAFNERPKIEEYQWLLLINLHKKKIYLNNNRLTLNF